ncbi:peptidase P60 [Photobacterium proteolyticum]|uniref:Peptidase P60 n=2 Tax=Photobacterium proteolyticum TaxID=1903952 RepID=A0A1Q9G909_9GAMM|nr:peptidase P60 [Photobacterium proteolyticum]
MNIYSKFLIVILSLAVFSGCSSNSVLDGELAEAAKAETLNRPQMRVVPVMVAPPAPTFNRVYESWKGTPYRLGGKSRRGIDCSAFVQVGYYDVFNKVLPRTTGEQARMGRWIPLADAKEGDLVFFKTGRRLRHVGIYLGNAEFLHASTSQGVMISSLANPYWRRAFWQVRRVPIY